MSEDIKHISNQSIGMSFGKACDNTFSNVEISGYDLGMQFDEASGNKFSEIKIISPEALKIIETTKHKLSSLDIDKQLRTEIEAKLNQIEKSEAKDNAANSYLKLMSSLSDHVTVLTPIWPQLCLLAGNLIF